MRGKRGQALGVLVTLPVREGEMALAPLKKAF
jgi:hypothetical protein